MHAARRLGMALLVGVVFLGLFEGLIRVTSVVLHDSLPSPLSFQAIRQQVWAEGSTADTVVYLGGRPREVLAEPVGQRVLVVGGSAVHGERYTPFSAFTGQMDQHLNRAIDTPVEVINLGVTGIAIRHVRKMVEMALARERPDLVVVYSGNNEFHEVRALKTIQPDFDSRIWVLRRSLFRLHAYRLLRRVISATLDLDRVQEPLGKHNMYKLETTVDGDDRALVESLYRQELETIVALVKRAGVPLLLTTVPDNMRWPRVRSECPPAGDQEHLTDEQLAALDEMSIPGTEERTYPIEVFMEDRAALHSSPRALCMVGSILAETGRYEEARPILERAEYYAPRPFRSNVVQRETVRTVAKEARVPLCDLSAALEEGSPGGLPGWDVFDDSCHPNALGHYRIGGILARCVLEQTLLGTQGDPRVLAELEQIGVADLGDYVYPVETDPTLRAKAEQQAEGGPAGNVFRLDIWRGTRDPAAVRKVLLPTDESPEATAAAGHRAFLGKQVDLAIEYYQLAIARGGPETDLQVSEALARLYMGDIVGTRRALDEILPLLEDESYLWDLRATLGP